MNHYARLHARRLSIAPGATAHSSSVFDVVQSTVIFPGVTYGCHLYRRKSPGHRVWLRQRLSPPLERCFCSFGNMPGCTLTFKEMCGGSWNSVGMLSLFSYCVTTSLTSLHLIAPLAPDCTSWLYLLILVIASYLSPHADFMFKIAPYNLYLMMPSPPLHQLIIHDF